MTNHYTIFTVDAFVDAGFKGNTAGVCFIDAWPATSDLQLLASRIGLAETAFVLTHAQTGRFSIRWFTPEIEMDLCGHATLAAAHIIFNQAHSTCKRITFTSASGELDVYHRNKTEPAALSARQPSLPGREGKHLQTDQGRVAVVLNFPARPAVEAVLPANILQGIGIQPLAVYKSRDYMLVYDSEEIIRNIMPDEKILNQINLDPGGIIVTARGNTVDFVSRFFTPQARIFEDPVTGSAHCSLIPYWSSVLGKNDMIACQLSERGGKLFCSNLGRRVEIGGYCVERNQEEIKL